MRRLYELILEAWGFSKWMYEIDVKEVSDWSRIYKQASNIAEKHKGNQTEHKLIKDLLCAVMDYYEAHVRDERKRSENEQRINNE